MSAKKIITSSIMFEVRCAKGELISSWAVKQNAIDAAKEYAARKSIVVRVTELEVTRASKLVANYG